MYTFSRNFLRGRKYGNPRCFRKGRKRTACDLLALWPPPRSVIRGTGIGWRRDRLAAHRLASLEGVNGWAGLLAGESGSRVLGQPADRLGVFPHCRPRRRTVMVFSQRPPPGVLVVCAAPSSWRSFPVDRKLYLSCLWPGLPELWWRGRLGALPTALAFTAAVNFLLVAKFVYPEWLASGLVRMAGWIGVGLWLFCVFRALRDMPTLLNPRRASGKPDRFIEAHAAYLRGKWVEAESLLTDGLTVESRDPPALLLLCGVYRHTGRLEAAERLIEEIRLMEAADRWWLEVSAEEKRLRRDSQYRLENAGQPAGGQPQSDGGQSQLPSDQPPSPSAQTPPAQSLSAQSPPDEASDANFEKVREARVVEVSCSAAESPDDVIADISAELDRDFAGQGAVSRAA